MSVKTHYDHIVSTPGIAGSKPHFDGYRISVQNIVIWHEQMGYRKVLTAEELTNPGAFV